MSRDLEDPIEVEAKKFKNDDQIEEDLIDNETEENLIISNESLYGIKEKINKNYRNFQGILKQSPGDFIVNEIDLKGQVVKLTNFDIPESECKIEKNPEELETMKNSFKDLRIKLIHDFVKQNYEQFVTNTIQKDKDNQLIEIRHAKNNNRTTGRDNFNANSRSKDLGDKKFTICALYKENIDTIQAVNLIAKNLRLNIKRIGYAGTKDKKAKTTQSISFFKLDPKEIVRLNKSLHNVKLGDFKTSNEGLKLGDLTGNRFKLVLREISESNDDYIREGLESLKNKGFINYFGLQRFGNSPEIPTHMIGKHVNFQFISFLIKNDIKEAIDLILKPRSQNFEKREIKKAREVWSETKDAFKALTHIQYINCLEKFLLNGLTKSTKNDYLGAFQFIPRNMRLMYLHAYQSYVWNEATSKRIEMYGLVPVVGDLVIKKDETNEMTIILNENNLKDYSIEDVVLPLPGYNIVYPENKVKEYYVEILRKDELNFDSFKNKIKDFSLGGDYRNILVKPKDMVYEILRYSDKNQILTKSDWDMINPNSESITEQLTKDESTLKAICLEYNLPTSSYATMALREILIESK
ncbi:unnamed protein product [Brachionus calyciflorus]|uniref:TRUD domain-containing protein n=1 Tax=Brachionus calyciflorus TaxID=104777 RepID=A0A813RJN5_9BILA|nr:unnamed protein product [Brachionus calyciflorus]